MKKTLIISIVFFFVGTNLMAQCFLDRHNTSWLDQWISCNTSMNPNAARGESHWILYDLNYPYELFQMHIWNINAPEYLADGMQELVIDISNDGINWTEVGTFDVPMADGTPIYEGMDLYDFEGVNAQYVLITGLSNHGGSCFGLSEIRIDVADFIVDNDIEPLDSDCLTAKVFPNPINSTTRAMITSYCNTAPIQYSIQDISGKTIKRGEIMPVSNEVELDLSTLQIVSGSYVLSLRQQDIVRRVKIVKVD